jgi:hypothetical protein
MGEGNAWRLVPNYFNGYPFQQEIKKVLFILVIGKFVFMHFQKVHSRILRQEKIRHFLRMKKTLKSYVF